MSKNTEVWDKLSKTDPKHTKSFTRAGGFKGTAIKPIYTTLKMTEEYGPEGVGWGFETPQYQVVPTPDGQIAVYCWTSLWFSHEGKVSAPVHGVGGDMVVVKQQNGMRVNDEAFKAAFTDAKGNALKEIGMSADVHMGLFDDHKYVRERENEEKAQGSHTASSPATTEPLDDSLAKKLFPTLQSELFAATTTKQLEGVWTRWLPLTSQFDDQTENGMGTTIAALYDELRRNLEEKGGDIRSEGREAIEASLRAAMSMDDLQDRWMKSGPAMKKLAAKDVTYLSGVKDVMKGVIQEMAAGAELARAEKAARIAATP